MRNLIILVHSLAWLVLSHAASAQYTGPKNVSTVIRDNQPAVIKLHGELADSVDQIRFAGIFIDSDGDQVYATPWINDNKVNDSFITWGVSDATGSTTVTPGLYKASFEDVQLLYTETLWVQQIYIPSAKPNDINELAEKYFPTVIYNNDEEFFPLSFEELYSGDVTTGEDYDISYLTVGDDGHGSWSITSGEDLKSFLRFNGHQDYRFNFDTFEATCNFPDNALCVPHLNRLNTGSISNSTVYWDAVEKGNDLYLSYYFMYAFDPKIGTASNPHIAAHVFDRESMTIKFNKILGEYVPIEVVYAGHLPGQDLQFKANNTENNTTNIIAEWSGGKTKLNWVNVPKIGRSAVIYKAKGAHAIYPAIGNYRIDNTLFPIWDSLVEPAGSAYSNKVLSSQHAGGIGAGAYEPHLQKLDLEALPFLSFSGNIVDVLGFGTAKFPPFIRNPVDLWVAANEPVPTSSGAVSDFDQCFDDTSAQYNTPLCDEIQGYLDQTIDGLELFSVIHVEVNDTSSFDFPSYNGEGAEIQLIDSDGNVIATEQAGFLPNELFYTGNDFFFTPDVNLSYSIKLANAEGYPVNVICASGLSTSSSANNMRSLSVTCEYNGDLDSDNIKNSDDNCPTRANAGQANFDGDAQGDACDSDDDNDGMPDTWELKYGLNPKDASDKNKDPDGDGRNNLQEYKDRSNPNIADEPRKVSIAPIISLLLDDPMPPIPEDGLVAHYKFDGDGQDASVFEKHANINGVSFVAGVDGDSAQFDGQNSYASTTASPKITKQITMSAWVSPNAQSADSYTVGGIVLNGHDYEFAITSGTNTIRYALNGVTSIPAWEDSGVSIPLSKWTHVAITYDETNVLLYIDGIEVYRNAFSGSMPGIVNWPLGIGARYLEQGFSVPSSGWYSHFSGKLDDVRVYNRALSADEIATLHLSTSVSITPLNDTGITWGGNYPSGNNATCTGETIAQQDCSHGRDATHNDDSDGHAGFSFTRLNADGSDYTGSGDYATDPWSCVKDNVTSLIWEVKQNMDGVADASNIHDADNTYRWGGKTHQGTHGTDFYSDWDSLVDGSNNENFCGHSDWRVPTLNELEGLVNFNHIYPSSSIDTAYFPNTPTSLFWSASPTAYDLYYAWVVNFSDGHSGSGFGFGRGNEDHVRLVRSGQ